jgi:hypothetical protein
MASSQRDLSWQTAEAPQARDETKPVEALDHNESPLIAAGVVQLAQLSAVDVPLPGTLERVVLPTQSDTIYDLPDGSEGIRAHQADGNLTLAFPNGGVVEFTGFAGAKDVEFHTADKGTLDAGSFIADLHQHETSGTIAPDNPLFTPGPGPEILGGLTPLGALPGTDLLFPQIAPVEHASLLFHDEGIFPGPENTGPNAPPVAPDGSLILGKEGTDPTADPDLNALQHFAWTDISNGGQPIALPSDPDGDPITVTIVSLPPELSNPGNGDVRFDLFVDEGGTKVPLHAGDVLTTDQLQNSLFSWVAKSASSPAPLGDLVYSVSDSHMHIVQGVISFSLTGVEQ